MKQVVVVIFVILTVGIVAALMQSRVANDKWEKAEANVKAYSELLKSSQKKSAAFQLTIDQLHYMKDSIMEDLITTQQQLKIKDKNLKALQKIISNFSKADTVVLKDTIFKDPSLNVDTVLGDEWYSLRLGLKYPSQIAVKPEFKSDKNIIVSTKRETINPPKKFFLFRWFQKKMTVIYVDVIEKNPYIENSENRYIEVIK